jgi:hypothetical protein
MKTMITATIFTVLMFVAGFANAAVLQTGSTTMLMPDHMVTYYENYLDRKVAEAESAEQRALAHTRMAELTRLVDRDTDRPRAYIRAGESPRFTCSADFAAAQADFYEDHRDQLVKEMMRQNIGFNISEMDSFLITSFLATKADSLTTC